jgi:S1-C subfamily serine protease
MNRPLRLLIAVAVAAAVGGLSAYALFSVDWNAPARAPAPAIALVGTRGAAVSSSAPGADAAVSYPAADEHPVAIVSYRDAVARAGPSVVTVHSAHTSKGALPLAPTVLVKGLGSGVIIDRDGYVVTNRHVIEGASQLAVALPAGTLHLTRVIGTDPESDIALLKIDVDGLLPITPADINDVAVGDVVLAVGNPLGIGQTVTQGTVAVQRNGPADRHRLASDF